MKSTIETDKFLKTINTSQFNQYLSGDYTTDYRSLKDYFDRYFQKHPAARPAEIIRKSRLDRCYANQILNGTKPNPSRNYLISFCLAMELDLSETNRLLKISKNGALYSKDPRDALIILCIQEGIFDVLRVSQILYENSFHPLDSK